MNESSTQTTPTRYHRIVLKPGREKSVLNGHPWIFSGAIAEIIPELSVSPIDPHRDIHTPHEAAQAAQAAQATPVTASTLKAKIPAGCPVEIRASDGRFLAVGYYNGRSQIACRVLSLTPCQLTADFFHNRIQSAWDLRRWTVDFRDSDFCRVVNSEGDFLPGLVIDKYGPHLVIQITTAGMLWHRADIIRSVINILNPETVSERSESPVREEEGLRPFKGIHYGELEGPVDAQVAGLTLRVSIKEGHKTGAYLDQVENLRILDRLLASRDCVSEILVNCFSYSAGFSLIAARRGMRAISVDSSAPSLALAHENFARNSLVAAPEDFICADCFEYLRAMLLTPNVIILDPPPLARRQSQIDKAARAYKDINLQALKKIAPGGLLLSFSCSQRISLDLFQKIIFGAAVDAKREVRIISRLSAGADHPVSLFHPEGEYLKGLALAVT